MTSNESKFNRVLWSNTLTVRFSYEETKIRNGYDICRRCYTAKISGHLGYHVGPTPRACWFYKKLKNVSCEYYHVNGWNSTLQAAWCIRYLHKLSFARVLCFILMKDIGRWLPWMLPGSTGRFFITILCTDTILSTILLKSIVFMFTDGVKFNTSVVFLTKIVVACVIFIPGFSPCGGYWFWVFCSLFVVCIYMLGWSCRVTCYFVWYITCCPNNKISFNSNFIFIFFMLYLFSPSAFAFPFIVILFLYFLCCISFLPAHKVPCCTCGTSFGLHTDATSRRPSSP